MMSIFEYLNVDLDIAAFILYKLTQQRWEAIYCSNQTTLKKGFIKPMDYGPISLFLSPCDKKEPEYKAERTIHCRTF